MKVDLDLIKQLAVSTSSKIVMLVIDGLGGIPDHTGKTELESANTPNMDHLAFAGNCGLTQPVSPGVTPGSAPGHLALFGYDPLYYQVGRGVLEALGIDFNIQPGDIAARGNFCTVDENGVIIDRRAGRIATQDNIKLCKLLDGMVIEGVEIIVRPVKDHRCVVVLHGDGLNLSLSDTDPQMLNVKPGNVSALEPDAAKAARVANAFLQKAEGILSQYYPANMLLLRGFSSLPNLPTMHEIYKLRSAAIASYPMYRGLARVVGMEVLTTGTTLAEEMDSLERNYAAYDFFFIHVKGADAAGEDGDFERKVRVIENVDASLPRLLKLQPDVIIIAGDHSTPAVLKGHSWHDVPCLIYSNVCRHDRLEGFGESSCSKGSLGRLMAIDLMPLAMAHALKLTKFGA